MKTIQIFFDDSYEKRDNSAGLGVYVVRGGQKMYTISRGLRGSAVHLAELNALIAALEEAKKLKFRYPNLPILLFGDNKGVIQKLKSRLSREENRSHMDLLSLVDETEILYDCAVSMFRGLGTSAEINWIPRKFNRADGCSKVGRQMQVKKAFDYAA
jgi:ribonuclease HI